MKKILILGGANTHCKLVRAAKELGLYTIVTDYLTDSPGKKIADEAWMLNIMDVDLIVERCKQENVEAVLATHLDPCQRPYYEICHKLGVPCYIDTWEQVYTMTDKNAFKAACVRNGVDIIPTYDIEHPELIEYPVLVKPSRSRGSRGQTVCEDASSLMEAVQLAEKVSEDNLAIIERYMGNKRDFSMTYMFIDGKPYITRIADRYLGSLALGLEKVATGLIFPSFYTKLYEMNVHQHILDLCAELNIQNGPVFMQGFVDGDTVRFYDPGYRFPGSEFDDMYAKNTGIDLVKLMVEFAVTGKMDNRFNNLNEHMMEMGSKTGIVLFPIIRAGKIAEIRGFDEIAGMKGVYGYTMRHHVGEDVPYSRDVNQRMGEIDIICDSFEELKETLHKVFNTIQVIDDQGNNMLSGNIEIDQINVPNGWQPEE